MNDIITSHADVLRWHWNALKKTLAGEESVTGALLSSTSKVRQLAVSLTTTRDNDDGIYNPFGYGIVCGESLCQYCCLKESQTCGTTYECDSNFTTQLLIAIVVVALFFILAASFLLTIGCAGGRQNVMRMSQVIL